MASQPTCEFTDNFIDENHENFQYTCTNDALASGYCKLHDENYLNDSTSKEVETLFLSELERSSESGKILCVGFHLPEISLNNASFNKPIFFVGSTFHGEADFTNSKFHNVVDFSRCIFKNDLNFTGVDFYSEAKFFKLIQEAGTSNFQSVTFHVEANFSSATLRNGLFTTVKFEDVSFHSATFNGETNFWDSIFNEKTDFIESTFNDFTDFSSATFKEQERVMFDGDLSNVSFKDTDITRIKFGETTTWGKDDRYAIYDAVQLEQNPESHTLGSVLSIYRNLRENYEYRLMYEEAGKVFVKEMELRRNYKDDPKNDFRAKKRNIVRRKISLTSIYSYLCEYGENFKRPVIWASVIFVGALLYFLHFPDESAIKDNSFSDPINYTLFVGPEFETRSEYVIERTLASFSQIQSKELPDLVVRIFSILILGILFIVLRRRFERRFRH